MSTLFESPRLRFRGFSKSDLDNLFDLFNDPEVQLGASDYYILPKPESFKSTVEEWANSLLFCIVEEKNTGRFIGTGGLRYEGCGEKNRDATVGLALVRRFWGVGYGTEVIEWLTHVGFKLVGLHRISLTVFASNPRAEAVYKNVGYVREGIKRKALWRVGRWDDIIDMAMLDEEYWQKYPLK